MSDPAIGDPAVTDPPTSQPPVKPRPVMFAVLCVAFVVWIALLVTLYVETVYPVRHSAPAPADQLPQP